MKVYVAGSTKEKGRVNQVQELCTARGWQITFDWTRSKEEGGEGDVRVFWDKEPERARELSLRERQAIREADVLILVWPEVTTGLGCHYETAWGMDACAETWIMGCPRDSVFFYQHDDIHRFPDLNALILHIRGYEYPYPDTNFDHVSPPDDESRTLCGKRVHRFTNVYAWHERHWASGPDCCKGCAQGVKNVPISQR